MLFKKLDVLVLFITILVIGIFSAVAYQQNSQKKQIVVTSPGKQYVYTLDEEPATYHIPGLAGDTVIVVKRGTVRVVSSPCPLKTCIAKGAISHAGDWLACLPNGVLIQINGNVNNTRNTSEAESFDALSE